MQPLISIIIPVYNADNFIGQCIESIITQTVSEWELILVNDGSLDNSLDVCMHYAEIDSRIKLINVENGGASKARNIGLNIAKGKWISFIDADDWIEPNFLSLINHVSNADIIYFGFIEHNDNSANIKQICSTSHYTSDNIDNVLSDLFISKELFFGFTWNKFYHKSIIDKYNLRFNESLFIKEDEEFLIRYCRYIKNIYISNSTPYNYRILQNSISHKSLKFRNLAGLAARIDEDLNDYPWSSFKRAVVNRSYRYYLTGIVELQKSPHQAKVLENFIKFVDKNSHLLYKNLPYLNLFKIKPRIIKKHMIKAGIFNPILIRLKPSYFRFQFRKLSNLIKQN